MRKAYGRELPTAINPGQQQYSQTGLAVDMAGQNGKKLGGALNLKAAKSQERLDMKVKNQTDHS